MSEELPKPEDTEEKEGSVKEELCEKVDFIMLKDDKMDWISKNFQIHFYYNFIFKLMKFQKKVAIMPKVWMIKRIEYRH